MLKRVCCILIAFVVAFAVAGCNKNAESQNSETPKKKVTAALKKGEPKTQGDVFQMPEIQSGGNLVIAEISKQAKPDDSVTLAGKGFSASGLKAYVYSQSTKDNGKLTEAKFTVIDDQTMSVVIDKSLKYGVYGIYLQDGSGKSNVKFVNKPAVWNLGFTSLSAGDDLNIYGENLTKDLGNKVSVYLVGEGEYCEAPVSYADPYKITATVPLNLKDGANYEVRIHSGHGGNEGFATASEKITFSKNPVTNFNGKVIDVTKFGADPKNIQNDDAPAIQKAINSAKKGDIIAFPPGVYFCNQNITVTKSLRFEGSGAKNSIIVTSNALEKQLFDVQIGPTEFTALGFQHKQTVGRIQSGFIGFEDGSMTATNYNLYIHDCSFIQSVTTKSLYTPIDVNYSSGIVIENNEFDSTYMVAARNFSKTFIRNNNMLANLYSGAYYTQQVTFFLNGRDMDFSGNTIKGKDVLKDDSGIIETNDLTTGRGFVLQGYGENLYVSKNHLERSGHPLAGSGELFLIENNVGWSYEGGIASGTENTVTLPVGTTFTANKGDIISITDGRGRGQYAFVEMIKKNVITVSGWEIAPDATSRILISRCFYNIAMYDNFFNGHTNYRELPGSTTAIQVYGSTHNLFFVNNEGEYLPEGICISTYHQKKDKKVISWCHFDGNKFNNCGEGVRFYAITDASTEKITGSYSIGITIRRNSFTDTKDFTNPNWKNNGGIGIKIGLPESLNSGPKTATWNGNWLLGTVIENNSFENSENADIILYKHQGKTLLRNNTNKNGDIVTKHVGGEAAIVVK